MLRRTITAVAKVIVEKKKKTLKYLSNILNTLTIGIELSKYYKVQSA